MSQREQVSTVDRLREGIDTVLASRGFTAGQGGADDRQGQIIWCAAAVDFAARFPRLQASQEPAEGWGTMCTDIMVDLASAEGQWRVMGVSIEGEGLDRLLSGRGLTAAAADASALIGSPVRDCLTQLPLLLIELLEGPDSQR